MKTITVIILTYNESKHIARCIESLKPFSKNIFVIDSNSTDGTQTIASDLGAQVFEHAWPGNHAAQFQWALDECPIDTEWVMKMDADEYVTGELSQEIVSKLGDLEPFVTGIYVKRRVHFMGKWIRHGGYYPTWLLRIWKLNAGHMEQRWMDEHIKLDHGNAIKFDNDIVDDNKNNLTWWTEKHNNYSTREAVDILNTLYSLTVSNLDDAVVPAFFGTQEQRKRFLKLKYVGLPLLLRPVLYFLFRYFIKLGFLDGAKGVIWHLLQGFWYRLLVDCKVYDIKRRSKGDPAVMADIIKDIYGIELKK